MARIKYVLNERRLGLIAATAPALPAKELLPSWVDPARVQAALRAESTLPKLSHQLQQKATARIPMTTKGAGRRRGKSGKTLMKKESGVVRDEEVAKEEVESRDEGWGGGKEAEEFVADTNVGGEKETQKA